MTANPAASGNGAMASLFHVGRFGRAVPEQYLQLRLYGIRRGCWTGARSQVCRREGIISRGSFLAHPGGYGIRISITLCPQYSPVDPAWTRIVQPKSRLHPGGICSLHT